MNSALSRHWPVMVLLLAIFALVSAEASAHRLLAITDTPLGPDNALVIDDVTVSQVGYHTASNSAPQLWMTFQGTAGQPIYFETGVPFIERLTGLRPLTLLVGPGLPEVDAPIALPPGTGAILFDTGDVTEPEVFDEEFTGTQSWIFGPWEPVLPETGTYYLVTLLPEGGDGKFWTAAGRAEVFGLDDILTLPQTIIGVRQFHEVFPWGGILGWGVLVVSGLLAALFSWIFGSI
ncbi:MAG: hypothetical protein RLZZ303_643 [Candidatus Hydrogenedentota bacterium]